MGLFTWALIIGGIGAAFWATAPKNLKERITGRKIDARSQAYYDNREGIFKRALLFTLRGV